MTQDDGVDDWVFLSIGSVCSVNNIPSISILHADDPQAGMYKQIFVSIVTFTGTTMSPFELIFIFKHWLASKNTISEKRVYC